MNEPIIVPLSETAEIVQAVKDINLQEISIVFDYLYSQWKEVDDYLTERGYPMIKDGVEVGLLQRVKDFVNDRENQ